MAKQNFLSGGYYGKLGMTVGQRWKNIRTIRSYVIPRNPRTEAQQANRGLFGDCVFYAQVGMQLNYKAPCFVAADKTSWNYRMSTARGLQDLGLTELNRFPLYPIDFSVPYQITSANVTEVIDETHIKVTVVGTIPEAERVLTMLLLLPGSTDWKERLAVCIGQNSSEDYYSFTFQLPDEIILSEGMQCRFISCDDTDSTTDLIASSQIDLEYIPIDEHEFDTTFVSLTRSGNTFTLTLAEPYQSGENTVTISNLVGIVNGVRTSITPPTATLINNNGNFAVVFTCPETENQNLWAFPSGCAIRFSEISSISSTVHATAENAALAISNDDLTRTYDNRIASVTRDGATFTLTYATTAPTSTSGSGSITVHAVSNGAFVDYTPDTYSATKDNVSFTQSYTNEEEILAFPSGSTALANLTRIGNGVTYTPYYTSANAVTNTSDLSRTLSVSPSWSTTDTAFIIPLASGATISSVSGSVSITAKNHNQIFQKSESATLTASNETNKIKLSSTAYDGNTILLSDDTFTLPAGISAVANGVTYSVPSQTVAVTKTGTQELSSTIYTITCDYSPLVCEFFLQNGGSGFDFTSHPSSVSLEHPTTQDFGDEDGGIETVTISDNTSQITDTGEMNLSARANFNATTLSLSGSLYAAIDGDEWYVSDTSGNVWKLPSDDYEFTPI